MSYQQSTQGSQGGSVRSSIDSRDSYRGSFRPSIEGRDSCTTFGAQVQIDKICQKFVEIDKYTTQIKQQLLSLSKISKDMKNDLETYKKEYMQFVQQQKQQKGNQSKSEFLSLKQRNQRFLKAEKREERHRTIRSGVNDMMHEQMKLIEQIQINIKNIHTDTDKIKFENILQKKVNGMEHFSKILVQQEKEFVLINRNQQKVLAKLKIEAPVKTEKSSNQYELQNLLNESDSSDEDQEKRREKESEEEDDKDSWENDNNIEENEFKNLDEEYNQDLEQQLQLEKEDLNDFDQFQDRMNQRTNQISNVASTIGKIQGMFQNLNEIVMQQGQTLNKFEDNIQETNKNTQESVLELKQAVKNESPTLAERLISPTGSNRQDVTTTCLAISFLLFLLIFMINFRAD